MASVRKRKWTHNGVENEAWVVSYTDRSGKRRQETFGKKKDADRARTRIENEIESGTHTAVSQTITIAQLAKEYNRHQKQRQLEGAIGRGYTEIMDLAIRSSVIPALGAKRLTDITGADLGEFMRRMREDQGLSAHTMKERRRVLLSMERWAVRRGYTKRRVLADAAADYTAGKAPEIRIPTKEEVLSILDAADKRWHRQHHRSAQLVRLMVHLAAFCGLRFGEICALSAGCIDLDVATIRVRHNLTRYGERKAPKSEAGNRDVPVPAHLVEMLRDWIEDHRISDPGGILFTTETGGSMNSVYWHRHWRKFQTNAGLAKGKSRWLHFHALRHFAGSWWIENDMPIPLVSTLLGHSDSHVTLKVYAHSLKTRDERAAAVRGASEVLLTMRGRSKETTTSHNTLY